MVGSPHLTLKGIRWSSTLWGNLMNGPGQKNSTHVGQPILGDLHYKLGYTNTIFEDLTINNGGNPMR